MRLTPDTAPPSVSPSLSPVAPPVTSPVTSPVTLPDPGLRVPGLLFWQCCLLAAICGIAAVRYPLPALAAGLITVLCAAIPPAAPGPGPSPDPSPVPSASPYADSGRGVFRAVCLIVCLADGYAWGLRSEPPLRAEAPDWLNPALSMRVEGRVAEVSGLPDRRLRIMLEELRPADRPEAEPLPGRVSWTWDQGEEPDGPRPLPGQRVRLNSKIRPVGGFRNFGVSDFSGYWAARGVWYTAWSMGGKGEVELSGQAGYGFRLRERWRADMVAALGGNGPVGTPFRRESSAVPPVSSDSPVSPGEAAPGFMSQGRAMLPALLFGDRYGLDSRTLDLFTRGGLVHSLALSGQHLALAGTVAALLVWLLSRGRGGIFLHMPRRILMLILSLPFAAAYLWLGGAPPSLIRASLMMLFGALLWLRRRPVTLLDILFFAVLCFVVAWPQSVFDLSVQLSVLSVLGIALALPWLRRLDRLLRARLPRPLARPLSWLLLLLGTSGAVQLSTLPVVVHTFGRVSPLFALNLLWLPVLGVLVLPLAALSLLLLSLFGPQAVSNVLFGVAALAGDLLLALLQGLQDHDALPVAQGLKATGLSVAGYASALAALSCLTGRGLAPSFSPGRLLLICAFLLLPLGALQRETQSLLASRAGSVTLRMLDVGQGQALVLEWPGGRMLLDAGGMRSPRLDTGRDIVAHALTANRPPRLEIAMLSHGDLDHARGMASVLELFQVGELAYSAYPVKDSWDMRRIERIRRARDIPARTLQSGDTLDLGGGLALELLHPPARGRFSANNASLILRLTLHGKGLALLCGDAEIPALRRLTREGGDLRAEVLVIPHHGSRQSLWPAFYDAVNPNLALISNGAYNSFGYPRQEVLDALAERGVEVLSTAREGELRVTWAGGSRLVQGYATQ